MSKESWLLARQIYPSNIRMFCGLSNKEIRGKGRIAAHARIISFNYCWMLSSPAIAYFLQSCADVEVLDLTYCTVKRTVLLSIAKHCKRLRSLVLCHSQQLSCEGLISALQRCPDLSQLSLSHSSGLDIFQLLAIGEQCERIQVLHLSYLTVLDIIVLSFLKGAGARLLELDISFCPVSDDTLHAIARLCPQLQVLNAACAASPWPADVAVTELTSHCTGLTDLNLSGRALLSDSAVEIIASNCPNLNTLSLNRCTALTGTALEHLAEKARNLQVLSVRRCPHIAQAGVVGLMGQFAALRAVYYGSHESPGELEA
jgi:Leucine-rich repeat (LRR) protein